MGPLRLCGVKEGVKELTYSFSQMITLIRSQDGRLESVNVTLILRARAHSHIPKQSSQLQCSFVITVSMVIRACPRDS